MAMIGHSDASAAADNAKAASDEMDVEIAAALEEEVTVKRALLEETRKATAAKRRKLDEMRPQTGEKKSGISKKWGLECGTRWKAGDAKPRTVFGGDSWRACAMACARVSTEGACTGREPPHAHQRLLWQPTHKDNRLAMAGLESAGHKHPF